jgi:hypothetical protein
MKNQFFRVPFIALAFLLLGTQAFAGPVSHFGALKVCKIDNKGYLCGGKNGTESTAIQVKGPSLFWHSSAEGVPFYVPETVDWFVDNMKIGVIRAAMGIRYLEDNKTPIKGSGSSVLGYYDDAATSKRMIKTIVDAAIANDIYVIVDWHSHNANSEEALAKTFFREMATEYKNVPNIIWELFNEPTSPGTSTINTYSNAVLNEIRNAGNNNLVLIGSEQWSSKPNAQASSWGTSDNAVTKNVAFTVHFYAAQSGHDSYMGNADNAMSGGYAVFASEWGFSAASGNGNTTQGSNFTTWMDNNNIGNCNWNVSTKNESSSMFTSGTSIANLSTSRLTTSGDYFNQYMTNSSVKKWTDFIPSAHPKGNNVVATVKDGNTITLAATDLGLEGEISEVSEPEFGEVSKTANSITYKAISGSQSDKIKLIYKITKGGVTVQSKITINITDRLPLLPQKNAIAVSRRAPSPLSMRTDLSVSDPSATSVLELTAVSLSDPSMGTVAISTYKDSIIFTPAASQADISSAEVTLNYTVKNSNGSNSASVDLRIQNIAPTITVITNTTCCLMTNVSNTGPVGLGMKQFNGKDRDGDAIEFITMYLDPKYPGQLEKVKQDSFVYYPDPEKIGKVVFLAIITDGIASSSVGRANLTLTGNGSPIGDLPAPTEIPGVDPAPIAYQAGNAKSMSLAPIGFGKVEIYFAQSGFAKLDVYSLSGKNMGSLLNGWQNAGSKEVSLKALNLHKGVYILRLSQGSQVKTLRVVK